MSDPFASHADGVAAPARHAFAVTPHATNALNPIPKALFIGTGGDVVLRSIAGNADVTFRNVASGQVLDVRAEYVRAAGTTAADIVGLA